MSSSLRLCIINRTRSTRIIGIAQVVARKKSLSCNVAAAQERSGDFNTSLHANVYCDMLSIPQLVNLV
jgi:hypothetical protein